MDFEEKRENPRINSPNLIYFFCNDDDNHQVTQGMGRTVNISEGGMMLETHTPINPSLKISITIALEDDLMDFKGKIVHSLENKKGEFLFGIQFLEMNDLKRRFLKQHLIILNEHNDANLEND